MTILYSMLRNSPAQTSGHSEVAVSFVIADGLKYEHHYPRRGLIIVDDLCSIDVLCCNKMIALQCFLHTHESKVKNARAR